MARPLILVAAVCALAACGSSAAAPTASSSSADAAIAHCGPATARTLAASSGARVYTQGGAVYGCAPGSGHDYRLGRTQGRPGSARVGPVAAAGALAAYGVQTFGIDTGTAGVIVRRLSDGKQLLNFAATQALVGPEAYQSVGSIVVDRGAQVAWIASDQSIISHRHQVQVLTGSRASLRVLDTGTSIKPSSLRLHGSTLTWSVGGPERSAKLG